MKNPNAPPAGTIPGTILCDALYSVEELKLRLNWSSATLEAAHCQGLRIYYLGGNAYCYGREVLDFLRSMPKPIEPRGNFTPAPCDPGINQAEADEVWAKACGCCELCNAAAFRVTTSLELEPGGQKRLWSEPRPVVVCTKCHQQLGGE